MRTQIVLRTLASPKSGALLVLGLGCTLVYGTYLESRYNADLAQLLVYRSRWLLVLLAAIALHLVATVIVQLPPKRSDIGSLSVAFGMLLILGGGLATWAWGDHGELRVTSGVGNNQVRTQGLVLELTNRKANLRKSLPVARRSTPGSADDFRKLNDGLGGLFTVIQYVPFASKSRVFKEAPNGRSSDVAAVQIHVTTLFSESDAWLDTGLQPSLDLGAAQLNLIVHDHTPAPNRVPSPAASNLAESVGPFLEVTASGGGASAKVPLSDLIRAPAHVGSVTIALVRVIEQAVVEASTNTLLDKGGKGENPALELSVSSGGVTAREVVYAKFASFTFHPNGLFGFKFRYAMPESSTDLSVKLSQGSVPANLVQCHLFRDDPGKVQFSILKGGATLLTQTAKPGEIVTTPWMGTKVTLKSVIPNAVESFEVSSVDPMPGRDLPPSAISLQLGSNPSASFWLVEGESQSATLNGITYDVRYGAAALTLPFVVELTSFTKKDYPGTQMAADLESALRFNGSDPPSILNLNHPLAFDGFTLSQGIDANSGPTSTTLLVSRDPGRPWILWGEVLLVLGLIAQAIPGRRGTIPAEA